MEKEAEQKRLKEAARQKALSVPGLVGPYDSRQPDADGDEGMSDL